MLMNLETIDINALWIKDELNVSVVPYLNHFSLERQQCIQSYRRLADRSRTVWAELLARYLLCQSFPAEWEAVSIQRDIGGKPFGKILKGDLEESMAISLSHSGSWVLCSIGRGESGVDVETETEAWEEIAERFFLPQEAKFLQKMPPLCRKQAFLCYWTIKESYLKYTGEGLTGDLSKIDCDALWRGTKTLAGKNYLLPDGAVAGICARRDCLPTQIRFISLEILKDFLETKSKVNVK